MKGIILAGGTGSRLFPTTLSISKHLIPIYDKPMIYYPLSVLMLAKIKDVLIITTPNDKHLFQELFQTGSHLGMKFQYAIQKNPNGIAESLLIGQDFVKDSPFALILGDNLFYSQGLTDLLKQAIESVYGAKIFGYRVKNANRYGVVTLNNQKKPIELIEKPTNPSSNIAVTGLYFYDHKSIEYAKKLTPSKRGELEISDINRIYLENNDLEVLLLGRGTAWLDAGTHESLLNASEFIHTIEERQGLKVACIEEIAYYNNWINKDKLLELSQKYNNNYGSYLKNLII
jgi:glucose-1-phosphate thymidylyltransferase